MRWGLFLVKFQALILFRWAFLGLLTDWEVSKKRPLLLLHISYNHETWRSYTLPKKIQKVYE